ncbi:hypothetical protein NUU61_001866 [Penicillium alfredii]|uniref:Methyltransferase domain-containing protein n=1 Tax=Penicillium alfredii TaxID=1506179 RepID=A0A9W9KFG4_9EURO|nr:uncharacterized protein NUU61_001866 [Penicillium alfredii]KAJ5104519.1 hypothetical protein NUU61_001866 [Penicillium alfredii]
MGQKILDIGCCFGQDLRRLALDAGRSDVLFGLEYRSRFVELGLDLFKDRDTFQSSIFSGDVFDESFIESIISSVGRFDVLYVGSLFHLFGVEQQRQLVRILFRLLKSDFLIFGRAYSGDSVDLGGAGFLNGVPSDQLQQMFESASPGPVSCEMALDSYEYKGGGDAFKRFLPQGSKELVFSVRSF